LRKPAARQHSNLAQSLGILPADTPYKDEFLTARNPGLPREHLIGSSPELSGRVVMTVKVDNLDALTQGGQPLPLYWRGFTYDVYTGQGWNSSATTTSAVEANAAMQPERAADHLAVTQFVSPVEDLGGTVYAAGDPIRLNLSSHAAWRTSGDLFGIRIEEPMAYAIVSLVPVADQTTLRQSGEVYPDWVRQRFLALPTEVPERVKALALRLTASAPTPYDRAVAIEDYLRVTYLYSLDVPIPPPQLDVTDYFLFDLKKGYCDYFATAMVVLARAAGVPARLAIGYAPGTYNLNSKRFIVSEADAHSWAEIYFPGIGWVPFEATPSRPALDRSQPLPAETVIPGSNSPTPAKGQTRPKASQWLFFPIIGLALATSLILIWFGVDLVRLNHLAEQAAAAEIYTRITRLGIRLGVRIESGVTPYEFSDVVCATLGSLMSEVLPALFKSNLVEGTRLMLDRIVQTSYRSPDYSAERIINQWLKIRWRLWLVWVLKPIRQGRFDGHSQSGHSVG
jgi:transglutaminase-like putative cysteine protease